MAMSNGQPHHAKKRKVNKIGRNSRPVNHDTLLTLAEAWAMRTGHPVPAHRTPCPRGGGRTVSVDGVKKAKVGSKKAARLAA